MSEAITKACDDCDGTGRDRHDFTRTKCVECDGTGRVPDVEATLRAEVARLKEKLEQAEAEKNHARQSQMLTQRARNEASDRQSAAWIAHITTRDAEVARLTAEVERLSQREPTQQECDEAEGKPDASGKTWPAGEVFLGTTCRRCIDCGRWAFGGPTRCPYCAGKHNVGVAAQMYLDDLRAANAEVERLKGREEAAKPLIMAIREEGDGVVFCPCCWKHWTKDASGCADGCPRAAWLAGCKS